MTEGPVPSRGRSFVLAVDLGTGGPKVGLVSLDADIVWSDHLAVRTTHGPGGAAPWFGPVRHEIAGGDEFVELGFVVQGGDALGLGADLGAHLLGLRR